MHCVKFLVQRQWDKSVRGRGNPSHKPVCATCITAPCARGNFRVVADASPGADMYPASYAAQSCRGPVWCSKIGSRSKPRARRHSVAHWFSRSLLTTVAPNCSLPSCAPTPSRLRAGLRPPRTEIGRRHRGPSRPRRCAPSCSEAPPAPASVAYVSADYPAMCRVVLHDGCDV